MQKGFRVFPRVHAAWANSFFNCHRAQCFPIDHLLRCFAFVTSTSSWCVLLGDHGAFAMMACEYVIDGRD